MTVDDPYIDPSTLVLRNIPKLKTQTELDGFEAEKTLWRSAQLIENPIDGRFDFEHLRAIHKHVFQDVYDWAGKPRTIPIVKWDEEGRSQFTNSTDIESQAANIFGNLAANNFLQGLTREDFVEQGAQLLADLNRLHPFREGNGRTQKLFLEHVAANAGHDLDFSVISKERMIHASIAAQKGDMEPMCHIFEDATHSEKREWLRKATRYLSSNGFDWQNNMIAATQEGKTYSGTLVAFSPNDMIFRQGNSIFVGRYADIQQPGATIQRTIKCDPRYPASPGDTITYTVPRSEQQKQSRTRTRRSAGSTGRSVNKDTDMER